MDIIQLNGVSKSFKNKVILRDINLNIKKGDFVVIMGESGCGKTTLLNMIAMLEPVSSGEIIIDTKDINHLKKSEKVDFYRNTLGVIFQGSLLQPHLSIAENIALPGIFAKIPKDKREQRVLQLSNELGISEKLKELPSEASGGQVERACIARALFLNPKIIIADEPTSSLDEENTNNVLHLLDQIRVQYNITIIVSSHNRLTANFATQLLYIKDQSIYDVRNS